VGPGGGAHSDLELHKLCLLLGAALARASLHASKSGHKTALAALFPRILLAHLSLPAPPSGSAVTVALQSTRNINRLTSCKSAAAATTTASLLDHGWTHAQTTELLLLALSVVADVWPFLSFFRCCFSF
jgi:hypothetical protein